MSTVNNVYEFLKAIAPEEMALESDNVGFLVGISDAAVEKIIVSLEITDDVIDEALNEGAELIVTHHPLFKSLTSVNDTDKIGQKIVRMLSAGISAICMHTNLDAAQGGVNDTLAIAVGIASADESAEPLPGCRYTEAGQAVSYGRVGYLQKEYSISEYLDFLKTALDAKGFRYYDAGRDVRKVAISAGGGSDLWESALKSGCDTFITADMKYKLFLEAKEHNINLIDGGHFCTENLITRVLAEKLQLKFPDAHVFISKTHTQIVDFY